MSSCRLYFSRLTVRLYNKIHVYKAVLRPVWAYGIQLWGTASNSNIEILQRFQSKTLRTIANAPWHITNTNLHKDLEIDTVKAVALKACTSYEQRLLNHPNELAHNLLNRRNIVRRLKKFEPMEGESAMTSAPVY